MLLDPSAQPTGLVLAPVGEGGIAAPRATSANA